MAKIIRGKPNKSTYFDAIGIAGIKALEERLLTPVVGNGTFMSGAVKGGIAFVLPMIAGNNKWSQLGATAFMIDSAEDIVTAALRGVGAGGSSSQDVI